ncbi:MAG: hypothetical protein COU11_02050 [Candidatus Harrisonbacteria bacterium CG10_big_fil_rev_8_21_14_0_10_49_15]|uniref:Phosphatidic acid phosphatase type 2/haloperoxidase domain-containing protein n=1 Tax=Candidatus Harrisonbacteria bacterium CG10_big_fil_rev_8_21_14_0_10_49_15 TaxID=1974587 RepID=A0A2H0UKR6_9BACT|nr:MAG: hypothetical protein COU11_02050 [Candidatus Harrisonbacteria bacterium CG10_big_fil_rev_8_21_14_0_10_49_15]
MKKMIKMFNGAIGKFFGDIKRIFTGRNLIWQGIAIAVTYFLVTSGFDGWVTVAVRESGLREIIRAAGAGGVGFWVPFILPIAFVAVGLAWRNKQAVKAGLLVAQAEITGGLLALFYKALTGRPGPSGRGVEMLLEGAELSEVFRFGFLRGGVFWGWPSSHITIAVSAAVVLMVFYKHVALIKYLALAYIVYMALSVSLTFHWFSDGVAGLIFGSIVGLAVVKSSRSVLER